MRTPFLALLGALFVGAGLSAAESQSHGLIFEKWVRDTFFDGYTPTSYTQQWDIPGTANRDHGGIPVNPKAIQYGAAIDLGDAMRQFQIETSFMLIVGFWQQVGNQKKFVNFAAVEIQPETWKKLWGEITFTDLLKFDALVKDAGRSVEEIRKLALKMKAGAPFTTAIIQMNPKIDSSGQRRLQCSLRFNDFFDQLAPNADRKPQANPTLFGVAYPGTLPSPRRK